VSGGWVGVDLDGTLAFYDGWKGPAEIGEPIELMLERVKKWIKEGLEVRIFTARVWTDGTPQRDNDVRLARHAIAAWCNKHLGLVLCITNQKDMGMVALWDDRAVRVETNTGRAIGG
jgi:hypothetical protein